MRVLTPTENKRFNEMIGFVGLSLAVLLALSLLSYSPRDASFNVSAPPGSGPARNWIGPVGAHTADLFFQLAGYGAFLFPIGMFLVAMRWFRSQLMEAPTAKLIGWGLLVLSIPAEMTLVHMPEVRGALPPGGLLGNLLAENLRAALNPVGANLVAIITLLTALFLATSFSFRAAVEWMKKPMATEGVIGQWMTRVNAWREARESARLRKQVEEIKIAGRKPVAQQRVSTKEVDEEEEDEQEPTEAFDDTLAQGERGPQVIQFHEPTPPPPPKKSAEPKISRGKTNFRLPPPSLLRIRRAQRKNGRERAEGVRARHRAEVPRVRRRRTHHADQSRAGGDDVRVQARGGHQVQPHHRACRRFVPGAAGGIDSDRAHPGKIDGRHRSAERAPRDDCAARRDRIAGILAFRLRSLTLPLGKDLIGRIRAADLAQMPHLLIAGSTGTGKSVFINSLLMGMLYKSTPDELKLVLVDPKRLELGLYADIPHLFAPVVTDPKVASNVLRNATREMERRLKLLAQRERAKHRAVQPNIRKEPVAFAI